MLCRAMPKLLKRPAASAGLKKKPAKKKPASSKEKKSGDSSAESEPEPEMPKVPPVRIARCLNCGSLVNMLNPEEELVFMTCAVCE